MYGYDSYSQKHVRMVMMSYHQKRVYSSDDFQPTHASFDVLQLHGAYIWGNAGVGLGIWVCMQRDSNTDHELLPPETKLSTVKGGQHGWVTIMC